MTRTVPCDTDVLVVGAGPTGLALACDLRRRGVHCQVIERASEYSATSRGKGIQPRTLEVLDDLGAATPLLSAGWSRNIRVRWHVAGKLLADLNLPGRDPLPDVPYPNVVLVPQWRTERALRDRLTVLGGGVAMGCELEDLTQDSAGVTASVRDAATGETDIIRSAYVVGCDGGHSTVRRALGLSLIGGTHAEHFVFGDVEIDGLDPAAAHVWFDGDCYLAASPFPGQRAWQVQATVQPDARGQVEPASLALFQRLFHDGAAPDIHLSNPTWLSNFVNNVRMVDRYRVGRTFLAGDAAHLHSPAGGQGMNMGIQDAYNLGWKIDLVLRGQAVDQLLDTYQEERLPIAQAVLKGTDIGYQAVFSPNPLITAVRDRVLVPLLRLPRLQQAVLSTTHQLDLNYRHSSLTRQPAGRPAAARLRFLRGPRAGDRAPDAELTAVSRRKTRLFDHLRGPHFTVLIFDASARTPADCQRLDALAGRIERRFGADVHARAVVPEPQCPGQVAAGRLLLDPQLRAHRRYGVAKNALFVIRPDGYLAVRARTADEGEVTAYLSTVLGRTHDHEVLDDGHAAANTAAPSGVI